MQAAWLQQPLGGHRSRVSIGGTPGGQGQCPAAHVSQSPDFMEDWGGFDWHGVEKGDEAVSSKEFVPISSPHDGKGSEPLPSSRPMPLQSQPSRTYLSQHGHYLGVP